ncbi:hypothetical protein [Alkaliphilus hydrothermalis]|uniref:Uncharacterized protein n=1 Tax=Alkaliphilus hydrothermalis TaxID=1482730 RepID=A0ABS2NLW7_9FIRM|nr:hypothetical protein [Alkaliphilus hydrothermalis]MBM7613943.1 hypothetical protein [Alkaliphilus hydrothermalis]
MWSIGQHFTNKGGYDVDLHGKKSNHNRKAGLLIMLRGLICLILFLGSIYAFPRLAEFFDGNTFVHTILNFLVFGLPILGLSTLQIPFGLYYFIRYFNRKD